MKKVFIISGLALLLIAISIGLFLGIREYERYCQFTARFRHLPAFSFVTMDSFVYTNDDLPPGKTILLINFNSECDYCEAEITDVMAALPEMPTVQVLLVTDESLGSLSFFSKKMEFNGYPQITVLRDVDHQMDNLFGNRYIPSSFIYDENHQLIRYFEGRTPVWQMKLSINMRLGWLL